MAAAAVPDLTVLVPAMVVAVTVPVLGTVLMVLLPVLEMVATVLMVPVLVPEMVAAVLQRTALLLGETAECSPLSKQRQSALTQLSNHRQEVLGMAEGDHHPIQLATETETAMAMVMAMGMAMAMAAPLHACVARAIRRDRFHPWYTKPRGYRPDNLPAIRKWRTIRTWERRQWRQWRQWREQSTMPSSSSSGTSSTSAGNSLPTTITSSTTCCSH